MTHWVIFARNGRIYAGADKIASTAELPSSLSGTGTMPGVRDHLPVSKIAQKKDQNAECIICCAGITFPQPRDGSKPINIVNIINEFLNQVNLANYSDSVNLLNHLKDYLNKYYYTHDKSKSYLVLGCGFTKNGMSSIAYYESLYHTLRNVPEGYLNSSLDTNFSPEFYNINTTPAHGGDPVEWAIQQEIYRIHRSRPDTVGSSSTIALISSVAPPPPQAQPNKAAFYQGSAAPSGPRISHHFAPK